MSTLKIDGDWITLDGHRVASLVDNLPHWLLQDLREHEGHDAEEKISRLLAALAECRNYFADRAGAENLNVDSPEPNEEAELMVMIERVMEGGA